MTAPVGRAVLLVGGKGSRLAPFTATFPKPLMPLDDVPILEVVLQRLIQAGIPRATLALGHLGELIQAYLHHRPELGQQIAIDYVREQQALGTAGALSLIEGLDSSFLVMNGDLLTDLDIGELVRHHRDNGGILTIATHRKDVKIDLGVIHVENGAVSNYVEKPTEHFTVSMGVYVYEPAVLKYIEPATYLDFPDLVRRLLDAGERVAVFPTDCMWLDIGRPDDYALAQSLYRDGRGGGSDG